MKRKRTPKTDDASAQLVTDTHLFCKYDQWPETVPVLTADHMCWNYSVINGDGTASRHDLLAWLDLIFSSDTVRENPKRQEAKETLEQVIAEGLEAATIDLWLFLESAKYEKWPSLEWQAECWNVAMARLGFEVS